MKKSKILFTAIACLAIATSFCQNDIKPQNDKPTKSKLRVADASVFMGAIFQITPMGTLTDFQKTNPTSVLLKENMDGFSSSKRMVNGMGGGTFNANLGLNLGNDENTNNSVSQFRIGFSYFGVNMSNSVSKTDRKPYDTLTSSQTGQTWYSDSVTQRSYSMDYKSQQIRIDVSLIYRTNPAARWSLYGGIGMDAGGAVFTYTDINYYEYTTIESGIYTSNSSNSNNSKNRSERIVNNNGYGYSVYLPIGMDFRVGSKSEFFKQLHLFYEFRPFINYMNIPLLGSMSGVGAKMGFGVRVTI